MNPDDPLFITDDPKKGKMDRLFLKMDRLYSLITLKQTIYDRLFRIVPPYFVNQSVSGNSGLKF